jgi:hypothetical protein
MASDPCRKAEAAYKRALDREVRFVDRLDRVDARRREQAIAKAWKLADATNRALTRWRSCRRS